MFKIVVIVSTDVIPKATRAAVESFGIQKLIHEIMTMRAHGAYKWRKKYPVRLSNTNVAVKPDQFPIIKEYTYLKKGERQENILKRKKMIKRVNIRSQKKEKGELTKDTYPQRTPFLYLSF